MGSKPESADEYFKGKNCLIIMIKKTLLLLTLMIFNLVVLSQEKSGVEMADVMRSNGKIYVVVAVILTIFIMLVIYLIRLDRKMTKLEKNIKS